MTTLLFIVTALAVAAVVWGVGVYNSIVTLRNKVDTAWAQIDVQLQRRLDLIPNLVESAKGYAIHENDTFARVVQARSDLMRASTPSDKMEADGALAQTLKTLFSVSEAYPDLKANENFLDLQRKLADAEDKISVMRHGYNEAVLLYNTAIQMFPALIVAKFMRFEDRSAFDASVGAETVPAAAFGDEIRA